MRDISELRSILKNDFNGMYDFTIDQIQNILNDLPTAALLAHGRITGIFTKTHSDQIVLSTAGYSFVDKQWKNWGYTVTEFNRWTTLDKKSHEPHGKTALQIISEYI